jgi:hypothetical protein
MLPHIFLAQFSGVGSAVKYERRHRNMRQMERDSPDLDALSLFSARIVLMTRKAYSGVSHHVCPELDNPS